MAVPLTVEEDRTRRQLALYERNRGAAPDCYRAIAEWWRIEGERSANPKECLLCADNMERLAADMEARPDHYAGKPESATDWQWSGLLSDHRGKA